MVKTKSACAAAAPAVSCQRAPASSSACARALVRLKTCRVWPALSRWPAMLRPMTPVPLKAREWVDVCRGIRKQFWPPEAMLNLARPAAGRGQGWSGDANPQHPRACLPADRARRRAAVDEVRLAGFFEGGQPCDLLAGPAGAVVFPAGCLFPSVWRRGKNVHGDAGGDRPAGGRGLSDRVA